LCGMPSGPIVAMRATPCCLMKSVSVFVSFIRIALQ
jgi:hypothetical protein